MSSRDTEKGAPEIASARPTNGYSMVEIVVAMAILMIMTAIAMPYLFNNARMFKSEDQAIKIMDLMQEAGKRAINLRMVVRIEIDRNNIDRPVLRMIDENGAQPDTLVKTIPLEPLSSIRLDVAPAGIAPPTPPNYAPAVYTASVWTARFRSNGSVVNAADVPISATLYSWRPIMEPGTPFNIGNLTPARAEEVRAVTIFGGSGAVRYWKYTGTTFVRGQ